MEKYKKGDIVSFKLLAGEEHYYMIRDVMDWTEGLDEDELDEGDKVVSYDIVLLYPVSANPPIENMIHEELNLEADFKSRQYEFVMQLVTRSRSRFGLPMVPKNLQHIVADMTIKPAGEVMFNDDKRLSPKPKKENIKMDLNAIFEDRTNEDMMAMFEEKMDSHLEFLHKALKDGDTEQAELQKKELERIRKELMSLEFFPLRNKYRK